jgi:hypothetical protein
MRLYHYAPEKWGLENLKKKRLKITLLDECNDPFELWGCWQGDPKLREKIRSWKLQMSQRHGMLCFSDTWHSPLMWSHYGDRHKGLCLGFAVPDNLIKRVKYVTARPKLSKAVSDGEIAELLFMKYDGWSYEREWRVWSTLDERSDGHYFYGFGEKLSLREIYVGSFSELARKQVEEALGKTEQKVFIRKTRLGFKSFSVVENRSYRNRDWIE